MNSELHRSASEPLPPKGIAVTDGNGGLKILMVAPQPFFRARGTPFSILHRIRALIGAGHRVDLVTYPFGEDVPMAGLRIFRCKRPPFVHDVKIGPSIAKLIVDAPLYLRTVRALREDHYDVLHSHEEAAFFAVGLARKRGIRHVYDMHSSLPQQLRNFRAYDVGTIRFLFERLERSVLQTCDGVITICPELADIVAEVSPSAPHAMIENTADDSELFGRSTEDVRATLHLKDRRIILYTGTLERYQGIDLLLGAVSRIRPRHPDARLLIVGGRPDQVKRYEAMARSKGIAAAVTFVGAVHPSRIPAFFEAADLIVSSRSSGTNTPLKIYGYMRSRRPLVATNLPTHTQALDSEVACLVEPTEEGLAVGMARVLEDSAFGQRIAEAAAARASQRFSHAAYIRKVTEFYERVASRSGQPRASRWMAPEHDLQRRVGAAAAKRKARGGR
ncbi:MAG: glycosyltransferase family 4 protein [Geminicoccaceae bacterium]